MSLIAWLERAFVTVLWTGFSPVSPGTVASAATCAILWFAPGALNWPGLLLIVPATFAGAWMSTRAIGVLMASENSRFKKLRRPDPTEKDPDPVTIDEFVGQWVTLLAAPHTAIGFAAAFVAFRFFAVLKPFGVRRLERMPGGWGIMMDDVGAGMLGLAAVLVLRLLFPLVMESPWPLK